MNLEDYYLGNMTKNEETIEQAKENNSLVYWKCKHEHLFQTYVIFAENIIENDLCPCCMKSKGENQDMATTDCTEPDSLYTLDYEMFEGELNKMVVQSDSNFINEVRYDSQNGIDWNINGKLKCIAPVKMMKKMTEQNQSKLKEIFETQKKYEKLFEVIQCESCGMYLPHYSWDKNINNEKCTFCNKYIHNPFSLGRWLQKHLKIKRWLQKNCEDSEFKKICELNKNDTNTKILIEIPYGIKTTTAFEITHGLKIE